MQIQNRGQVTTLLMRARPYRTVNNRIDGVVVTFVDVNALANAERARFAALARASGDARKCVAPMRIFMVAERMFDPLAALTHRVRVRVEPLCRHRAPIAQL